MVLRIGAVSPSKVEVKPVTIIKWVFNDPKSGLMHERKEVWLPETGKYLGFTEKQIGNNGEFIQAKDNPPQSVDTVHATLLTYVLRSADNDEKFVERLEVWEERRLLVTCDTEKSIAKSSGWSDIPYVQREHAEYVQEVCRVEGRLNRYLRALQIIESTSSTSRLDAERWQGFAMVVAQAAQEPNLFIKER